MAISDIVRSIGSSTESAEVTVNMHDKAYHVKIGPIELGVRDLDDPDTSQPNPLEIRYTQEFEIVVHKTVGRKPLTQCTIPVGLWETNIKFNTLKGTDGDLSEKLKSIKLMIAGPVKIYTAFFPEGLCSYFRRKEIVQIKGADDWYHTVELQMIEANGGDI